MTKIGVIGSGTMGQGIAQLATLAGYQTTLIDCEANALKNAETNLWKRIDRLVEKSKLSADEAKLAKARLNFTVKLHDLSDSDLVVEAIVENLEAKRKLFLDLEELVAGHCLLTTNTSSLSVTAIGASLKNPSRFAGLHFFNPVPLMKVVEVVKGVRTDDAIVTQLKEWVEGVGHQPALCIDSPGFIINHAGRGYGTEALRIVDEKIATQETIDSVLKATDLFRMGPFELMDLVGLDVSQGVMESIYEQFYQEPRFRPSPTAKLQVNANLLGRKTKEGFYRYPREETKVSGKKVHNVASSVWLPPGDESHLDLIKSKLDPQVELHCSDEPENADIGLLPLWGQDLSSEIARRSLDGTNTFAIDLLVEQKDVVLMASPLCSAAACEKITAAFSTNDQLVHLIDDSPGFITQRVLAMIVNIGCEIVQRGICSPQDLDDAVKLGLGYKFGPLSLGDRVGPKRVLEILANLREFYQDPRYRPSPWLSRRAKLGMSLLEVPHYKKEEV